MALLAAAACESSGEKQTRNDVPRSRTSASSPADESGDKLLSHPKPRDDDQRLPAGDVPPVGSEVELSEEEWRERLTEKEFEILRKWGTEPAHSGDLLDVEQEGIFYCAGCGAPVFSSKHKFKSSTGWPSYSRPYDTRRVGLQADDSLGMTRTEVHCERCGGHLGHVFDDGPDPTGKRYCINSLALDFKSTDDIRAETEGASGSTDE
jgi:peptide-methionine (R)-S-oxide reductase